MSPTKPQKAENKQFTLPIRPSIRRPVLLPRPPPRPLYDEFLSAPFLVPAIPSVVGKTEKDMCFRLL